MADFVFNISKGRAADAMKIIAAIFLTLFALPMQAGHNATLTWTAPTTRVPSGVPLAPPEIASFRIYCGSVSGGPYTQIASPLGTARTAVVQSCVQVGTGYFRMTTVDTDGLESGYSSEGSKVFTAADLPENPVIPVCAVPPLPIVTMTVAPRTGYTDRPLYADLTRARTIGRILIGVPCESLTLQTSPLGEWRWATNAAGLRGVTLCK